MSLYDQRYSSSVLQTLTTDQDCHKEGYSCFPEPPIANAFNVPYNVTQCYDEILTPSTDSVLLAYNNMYLFYYPFGGVTFFYAHSSDSFQPYNFRTWADGGYNSNMLYEALFNHHQSLGSVVDPGYDGSCSETIVFAFRDVDDELGWGFEKG